MSTRKQGKPVIAILFVFIFASLCGGIIVAFHFSNEIDIYTRTKNEADSYFRQYTPEPFINSAVDAEPYDNYDHSDDALFVYEAPEGFSIISHSPAWNRDMLADLYYELKLNKHGDEVNLLYEIVIYPHEQEEGNMLASYSMGTTILSFFTAFPSFPPEFTIDFLKEIGSINLYGGNTNTTVESMANSLSHEYGHLYTFYYMFDPAINGDDPGNGDSGGDLAETEYARLREAARYGLITNASPGSDYLDERHRYLFEVAAEDYVQIMGSPTTRQVVDFVDVQQVLQGAEPPLRMVGARNAFPQENMMIPLALYMPGLEDYFNGFINAVADIPIEEKQDILPKIVESSIQHNLVDGLRTFVFYTITWNTPYQNAIYTLICYDPDNYSGWGIPVKTVRPDSAASAVIGEYVITSGDQVISMDDGNANGSKVFLAVALLPDGTYYVSDKLEYRFGGESFD